MSYISPEREEEFRDKKFDDIYFSSYIFFLIVCIVNTIFMDLHLEGISTLFELFFLLLKIFIFSFITTIFYIIISLFLFSMSFHFGKRILYFFYKI
jgi:hypothetical protein